MSELATKIALRAPQRAAKEIVSSQRSDGRPALRAAAIAWFMLAAAGQLFFVAYLLLLYGRAALHGEWTVLNKVMPHGYVAGDAAGNFAIAAHIALATYITVAGLVQLVPQIRARAPALHRWNGRIYLVSVCAACIAGLYMVWFRGSVGDLPQHLGISLDAVAVLLCAFMTVRHAIARRIAVHRRWALRLFMAANAVWFFRVGMMFWILLNHGPAGFDSDTFTGPFLTFLSFADVLLPLAMVELYLRAQDRGSAMQRRIVAVTIGVMSIAMSVGIFGAIMGLWLPQMT